jgi:hypothetical protein
VQLQGQVGFTIDVLKNNKHMIKIDNSPITIIEPYKSTHKFCGNHREEILNSKLVGCFYCCEIYDPKEINEWVDKQQTAICPKCSIDSVLPENHFQNTNFLEEMRKVWF